MNTRALLLATTTFGLGLLCGWWLAQAPSSSDDSAPQIGATQAASPRPAAAAEPLSSTVWLTVEFDQSTRLVAGTRIAGTNLLLASLPAVYPARAVYISGGDNSSPIFPSVVAADGISQLIAFEYAEGDGYDLSGQNGSLYLGRDVRLRWPNQSMDLSVASPLRQNRRGHNFFEVALHTSYDDRGGPLLDEQGVLVGLLLNNIRRENTTRSQSRTGRKLMDAPVAIDAESVREFLDRSPSNHARLDRPMDMRQFSAYWATTPHGLTSDALRLAEVKRWTNAYNKLQQVWDSTGNLSLFQQDLYVHSAYEAAHQMIDQGDALPALALIETMQNIYPESEPWCQGRTRALEAAAQYAAAVNSVRRCLTVPSSHSHESIGLGLPPNFNGNGVSAEHENSRGTQDALRSRAVRAALAFARDNTATRDARYTTLQDALSIKPNAELYRALGDLDYAAQHYARANEHYHQAILLDPSLAAELQSRLRNSNQRAQTAPAAEVSYETNRGGIVINLQLNRSGQSFRFLVDTGATYTAISTETLLRLGLNDIFSRGAPTIELQSANGPIFVQRFTLDAVTVGNATVSNVPVVLLEDFGSYDGLLGLSFLRHFDVNLDQQAGKLILTRR